LGGDRSEATDAGRLRRTSRRVKFEYKYFFDIWIFNVIIASKMGDQKPAIIVEEFENGKIESTVLSPNGVDLVLHGPRHTYHGDTLVISETYINDLRDGIRTKYYLNGDIQSTSTWVNGIKHGKATYTDEEGVTTVYEYVAGAPTSMCLWDQQGEYLGEVKLG
jgi:antitoxin component YwqK of YwqJK toxin-antitoxin module